MRNLTRRGTTTLATGVLALVAICGAGVAAAATGSSWWSSTPTNAQPISGIVAASPAPGASGFTLTLSSGSTVTVTTTASTTYGESGTTTAPTGVLAGERVDVTPAADPAATATAVTASQVFILLAEVRGVVQTGASASSFSVAGGSGLTQTVLTNGNGANTFATSFTLDGAATSGVQAGQYASAYGIPDPGNSSELDALFVNLSSAPTGSSSGSGGNDNDSDANMVSGTVAASPAPTSTGFTVTDASGNAVAVTVTGSTTFSESGTGTPPTGVTAGERVFVLAAQGTTSTASSLTAGRVFILLAEVRGIVQANPAPTASQYTVMGHSGLTQTVVTNGTTTYTVNGQPATGVTAGEFATAYGLPDATDSSQLDAQFVYAFTPSTNQCAPGTTTTTAGNSGATTTTTGGNSGVTPTTSGNSGSPSTTTAGNSGSPSTASSRSGDRMPSWSSHDDTPPMHWYGWFGGYGCEHHHWYFSGDDDHSGGNSDNAEADHSSNPSGHHPGAPCWSTSSTTSSTSTDSGCPVASGRSVRGTVATISGNTVSVTVANSTTPASVVVTNTTKFVGSSVTSLAGLAVGDHILAFGTDDGSGNLDATVIVAGSGSSAGPDGNWSQGHQWESGSSSPSTTSTTWAGRGSSGPWAHPEGSGDGGRWNPPTSSSVPSGASGQSGASDQSGGPGSWNGSGSGPGHHNWGG